MRLLQFPRLGLTFHVKEEGGIRRLVSADFGNLSVPLSPIPEQVCKLLTGIPHAAIFCDEMQALHVLVPQYLPMRPKIKGRPFTTDIASWFRHVVSRRTKVFERLGKWGKAWAQKTKAADGM